MGILSTIGLVIYAIFKFVKSILVKYITHTVIISLQFAFTTSAIVVVVAFVTFAITSIVALYNQIQNLLDFISSANTGALDCFFRLLDCSGVLLAFNNGITLIFAAVSGVAMFHLFKFILYAIKFIGNELFKLGVLLGQAVS